MVCDGSHYDVMVNDCCRPEYPCEENQGDCDNDYECQGNLKCGEGNGFENNCPTTFPSMVIGIVMHDCCYDAEKRIQIY